MASQTKIGLAFRSILLRTTEYGDDTLRPSKNQIDFGSPSPNVGEDEALKRPAGQARGAGDPPGSVESARTASSAAMGSLLAGQLEEQS